MIGPGGPGYPGSGPGGPGGPDGPGTPGSIAPLPSSGKDQRIKNFQKGKIYVTFQRCLAVRISIMIPLYEMVECRNWSSVLPENPVSPGNKYC